MTPTELAAARRARAQRWASASAADMRGYPALHEDDETPATLAASPPERAERDAKKPKLAE